MRIVRPSLFIPYRGPGHLRLWPAEIAHRKLTPMPRGTFYSFISLIDLGFHSFQFSSFLSFNSIKSLQCISLVGFTPSFEFIIPLIQSFTSLRIYSLIQSLTHFVDSWTHESIHALILSARSVNDSFSHIMLSLISQCYSFTQYTHSFNYSKHAFIHSVQFVCNQSYIHSFIHTCTHLSIYSILIRSSIHSLILFPSIIVHSHF